MTPVRILPRQVPVAPEREEARGWLSDELAKAPYQDAMPSLLEQGIAAVLDWLAELLSGVRLVGSGPGTLLLAVGAILVIVVAVLLVRPRVNARRKRAVPEVFADEAVRSSAEHRRLAAQAAAARNWNQALAERLRAIIRSAEERNILDSRPGRTAGEVAVELEHAFGPASEGVQWLAARFNEVHYGALPATRADHEKARLLDRTLSDAKPPVNRKTRDWAVPR